jgi:hypothetical protein
LPHPCCFETHSEKIPTTELIAELPSVLRLAQPGLFEQFSVMPPIDARVVELLPAAHAKRPPGAICSERSLWQSWLI